MKKVVSISLGSSKLDCNFKAQFLDQGFQVVRIGADHKIWRAKKLLREWQGKADAIGLGMVPDHYWVGTNYFHQQSTRKLEKLAGDTPVSTGARLREIVQEWSLRSAQAELGNIFKNARVLFLSGSDQLPDGVGDVGIHPEPVLCRSRIAVRGPQFFALIACS